jgi:hypothetical protein
MANLAIYNGLLQSPKSVADYNAIADESDIRKQTMQSNALALQSGQMGLLERQKAAQENEAFNRAIQSGADPNTPEGLNMLRQAAPGKFMAAQKAALDAQNVQANIGLHKAQAGKAEQDTKAGDFTLREKEATKAVNDILSFQHPGQAIQDIQAKMQGGKLPPDKGQMFIQQLQGMKNPGEYAAWQVQLSRSIMEAKDREHARLQEQGQTITMRGQDIGAQTAAAGQARQSADAAAGRAVTMRGQNLTDDRARDLNATTKTDKEAQRKEVANEKAVTKFSDTLQKEGIPEIEAALAGAEGAVGRYTEKGPDGKPVNKPIPGMGRVTGLLPAGVLTEEGNDVRQSIAQIRNIILQARSGAAVTDQELRRMVEELGTGFQSDDSLRRGLVKLRTRFEKVKQNIAAGVSDEVKQTYEQRGGVPITRGGAPAAADIDALVKKYAK